MDMKWVRLPWTGLRMELKEARAQIAELHHTITITTNTGDASTSSNVGNSYKSYSAQVNELSLKSEYKSDWGNQLVNNIAVLRAFFTLGNGFTPQLTEEGAQAERTLAFVEEFIAHNDLDDATVQLWAQEQNIEGKAAVIISPDTKNRGESWLPRSKEDERKNPQIKARLLPWVQHRYKVETEDEDYINYTNLIYTPAEKQERNIPADEFVYARFGGRISKVNDSPPVMGAVLNAIENLDKAITDWRKANHLYAAPTPWLNCETSEIAEKAKAELGGRQWKVGKLLITAGANTAFQMVGISEKGPESLKEEVIALAKLVSGATGVPVQFLGLPDLLSNRSTADNLMEQIVAAVNGERQIWKTFFEQLINKAIRMANENFKAGLLENVIEVNIVEMSSLQLHRLTQVYLPLSLGNVISKETVRDKVPGIDKVKEKALLAAEEKAALESLARETELAPPGISESNNQGRNF